MSMDVTQRCQLKLPETREYYSINILNNNFKLLDYAFIEIDNTIEKTESRLQETINQIIGGELEGDYSSIIKIVEKLKSETEFIDTIEEEINGKVDNTTYLDYIKSHSNVHSNIDTRLTTLEQGLQQEIKDRDSKDSDLLELISNNSGKISVISSTTIPNLKNELNSKISSNTSNITDIKSDITKIQSNQKTTDGEIETIKETIPARYCYDVVWDNNYWTTGIKLNNLDEIPVGGLIILNVTFNSSTTLGASRLPLSTATYGIKFIDSNSKKEYPGMSLDFNKGCNTFIKLQYQNTYYFVKIEYKGSDRSPGLLRLYDSNIENYPGKTTLESYMPYALSAYQGYRLSNRIKTVENSLGKTIKPTDIKGKDLNDITTTGFYNGSQLTNAPFDTDVFCGLLVINMSGGDRTYCFQLISDVYGKSLYVRFNHYGKTSSGTYDIVWSDWKSLVTSNQESSNIVVSSEEPQNPTEGTIWIQI